MGPHRDAAEVKTSHSEQNRSNSGYKYRCRLGLNSGPDLVCELVGGLIYHNQGLP